MSEVSLPEIIEVRCDPDRIRIDVMAAALRRVSQVCSEPPIEPKSPRPAGGFSLRGVLWWIAFFCLALAVFRFLEGRSFAVPVLAVTSFVSGVLVTAISIAITVWVMQRRTLTRFAKRALGSEAWLFRLSATHVEEEGPLARYSFPLSQVLAVEPLPEVSLVICPGVGFLVSDADLPPGVSPDRFRAEVMDRVERFAEKSAQA